ncbi:MAG: helix-turn-helix transcriptional regulator [Bacteroidetes bacterium]|nr:helix-turn-helix transcriptional regulator [Bacteroidota bacterium]MBS1541712.1 helix-turn-helix transcriptional regulator [Bacteroidota bacterium]
MTQLILALRAYQSDVEIHQHAAFQVVLTEDEPFDSFSEGKNHKNIYGFVIRPQVAHACKCSQSNLIILNIEPYSAIGKNLSNKLKANHKTFYFFSKNEVAAFFNLKKTTVSVQKIIKNISGDTLLQKNDDRVVAVLDYIHSTFNSHKISLKQISQQVCLSPSRLGFIFKKQIGSSIFKYLLWTRLRFAISLLLTENKKSITEIALESGFYDSAQMTKYMYALFGISPSKLKQKSDLIQFLN